MGLLGLSPPSHRICPHHGRQEGSVHLVCYAILEAHCTFTRLLTTREPRGQVKDYTYSKVMMWVAIDRGIRLADKRCLPCPHREKWIAVRDNLYETIQEKSFNTKLGYYGQSFEENDILDSAVCELVGVVQT